MKSPHCISCEKVRCFTFAANNALGHSQTISLRSLIATREDVVGNVSIFSGDGSDEFGFLHLAMSNYLEIGSYVSQYFHRTHDDCFSTSLYPNVAATINA